MGVPRAVARAGLEAAPPPGYYASAQGQTGAVLRLALHGIIKGHTGSPRMDTNRHEYRGS